jgi:uncharacterized protein (DUF1697 family)
MTTYLVLVRGINVGGKNAVSMAGLKTCLEELGYENVKTFLNSGNVVLDSKKSAKAIQAEIDKVLPTKFKLDSELVRVLALSRAQYKSMVDKKPKGFGEQPGKYHSDAIFLMGITTAKAMPVFSPRDGVDVIWPGKGVIYSQRLSAQRTKSRLNRIMGTPEYAAMTIRSWSTTMKLLKLMEE